MAVIRYIGGGAGDVKLAVSMNNGLSWQEKTLKPGQSFPIPPNATNLLLNNVPYDPKRNHEIRNGKITTL